MTKLFGYLSKRERLYMLFVAALICVQIWLELKLPEYMSAITVIIETPGSELTGVVDAGIRMLACALASALTSVFAGYFSACIGSGFSFTLREAVFAKVGALGIGEMNGFSTPSLITRTTNDIGQMQMVISMGLQIIIRAPVMAVWAIFKIVGKSWELSLATAVVIVIVLCVILIINIFVVPKFKIIQKKIDEINRITRENLTGLRVIRAFNAEEYQEEKFDDASESLMRTQLFTSRMFTILMPFLTLTMSGLSLAIYWIGAYLLNAQPLEGRLRLFSDIIVFGTYATYVIMSFMMMAAIFVILPRAQVSAKRIREVLDCGIAVKEGERASGVSRGEVEFKNVSFRYPGAAEDALTNISFKANKGETVAFIGATGSGKTTLINMVTRLYDATQGEVLVDGVNVREYSFEGLYNAVSCVTQKAVLFSDTIAKNLSFGKCGSKLSETELEAAVDVAQASDFISEMPEGMSSELSRGGMNVSGGQKQRLSIARAVARKPEILIFDDSFSALDFQTERKLRDRLAEELKDTTCLIVAQRVGTIRGADKIIVLEEGEAVGIGTHAELMQGCEVYREIALSQLSAKELEDGKGGELQ